MEQGCGCELQGAYFANWNSTKMVIPYGMVDAPWFEEWCALNATPAFLKQQD